MTLTYGELFAGIGGLSLGLERAGLVPRWFCENDTYCNRVLAKHWPDVPRYGDIKELDPDDLEPVDLIAGGFPCQDLSVAGKRAGLGGARSGLFWQFARIIAASRPRWVVVENVPGLLSSGCEPPCPGGCVAAHGGDMGAVLGTLGELGYGWAYRVLDARYFRVPQRRRRVLIVGCLGDRERAQAVLLESQSRRRNPATGQEAWEDVASTLGSSPPGSGWRSDTDRMTFVPHLSFALNANERWDGESETFIPVADTLRSHPRPGSNSMGQIIGFQPTNGIDVMAGATSPPLKVGSGLGIPSGPAVAYNPFHTLERDGSVSSGFAARPVVDALHGPIGNKEPLIADTMAVRRLTPLECERLQGFPDGWTAGETDSARYRMLGNAVCVNVAGWLARRIVEFDRERAA